MSSGFMLKIHKMLTRGIAALGRGRTTTLSHSELNAIMKILELRGRTEKREEETGMKGELELPPGFRFHPTDDELVNHYLCRKCAGQPIAVPIIKEVDLYKFDPWQLPEMGFYGEKEWYFFSPRDRKYPNGSRPNRAAGSGYWKATGADKPIGKPKALGIKKALLDDWVLCRIYNKKGKIEKFNTGAQKMEGGFVDNFDQEMKPEIEKLRNEQMFMESSESMHRVQTESSGSEQVVSAEVRWEREVQSHPKWNDIGLQLENAFDFEYNYFDNNNLSVDDPFGNVEYQIGHVSPLQDILMEALLM
ncbi:hypothetical protein ACSQ67_019324 [Phaseolus vulgaris]